MSRPPTLRHLDLVIISEACPYREFRGRTGHILGLVEPEMCGVFVDPDPTSVEPDSHLVCVHPRYVIATGGRLEAQPPGPTIRVNQRGEVL